MCISLLFLYPITDIFTHRARLSRHNAHAPYIPFFVSHSLTHKTCFVNTLLKNFFPFFSIFFRGRIFSKKEKIFRKIFIFPQKREDPGGFCSGLPQMPTNPMIFPRGKNFPRGGFLGAKTVDYTIFYHPFYCTTVPEKMQRFHHQKTKNGLHLQRDTLNGVSRNSIRLW